MSKFVVHNVIARLVKFKARARNKTRHN